MRRIYAFLAALLLLTSASAQVDRSAYERQRQAARERYEQMRGQARQRYDDAKKKAEEEYAAFRKKANEDYARFLQQTWEGQTLSPAEPQPVEPPPPPRQPIPVPDKIPAPVQLPQADVAPVVVPPAPVPVPPVPEPEPEAPTMRFAVYGTTCQVHADASTLRFRLASVDEKGTAEAWKALSSEKYDGLLHDCLAQREALRLGDWGYLRLLQAMSEELLGKGTNEAVLLQMFLLTQSGYNVRIAKTDGHLALLVPFNRPIYSYSYVSLNGTRYYLLTKSKGKKIEVCNVGFPREQVASVVLAQLPALGGTTLPKRTFAAEKFGTLKAAVGVDKSLIEFMNDYPVSDAWDCYAHAGLSQTVKACLYPVLQSQIEGKSKKKAAAMLLDFVQTAFDYATDQEQFGYERPLFGDESFHYPKNDCEDRSILYSILVRDLLGLKVVLVEWPGHLGTAVCFPEEVSGDYFTVGGEKYTVCDPTYIGAGIGMTMPDLKGKQANLVML